MNILYFKFVYYIFIFIGDLSSAENKIEDLKKKLDFFIINNERLESTVTITHEREAKLKVDIDKNFEDMSNLQKELTMSQQALEDLNKDFTRQTGRINQLELTLTTTRQDKSEVESKLLVMNEKYVYMYIIYIYILIHMYT